ncbi:hypothetical protein D3C75_330600 [compost metagenome]
MHGLIDDAGVRLEVGHELQAVGRFGGQAAGLDLDVPHHARLQLTGLVGGIALQTGATGGGQIIAGIPLEHASPGVGGLAVAILEHEEAIAGDRQVQPAPGPGHVAVAIEVLGDVVHLHATGLAAAVDGGKLGTAGLEARGAGVGHVVADDTQFLVDGAQAAQSDTKRHSFAPI